VTTVIDYIFIRATKRRAKSEFFTILYLMTESPSDELKNTDIMNQLLTNRLHRNTSRTKLRPRAKADPIATPDQKPKEEKKPFNQLTSSILLLTTYISIVAEITS
jgi:hypothetical protein